MQTGNLLEAVILLVGTFHLPLTVSTPSLRVFHNLEFVEFVAPNSFHPTVAASLQACQEPSLHLGFSLVSRWNLELAL